jgi:serine/threonine protein kinase
VALEINSVIAGRYVVQKLLASGGSSDVYGAYDTALKVHRVLKVGARPDAETAHRWLRVEADFLREARSEAFPACYDLIEAEGHGVLVLELCRGRHLDSVVLPPGPTALLAVGRRLLGLLAPVHAKGHVYRDLKPSNVLVPDAMAQSWKLLDFGSVCPSGTVAERVGTAGFSAPEVIGGGRLSSESDVFSIGRCLGQLAEKQHLSPAPAFADLLQAMTDVDPRRRPSDSDLERWVRDVWLLEVGVQAQGHCLGCFAELSPKANCGCAERVFSPRDVEGAVDRLVRRAEARGEVKVAARILERGRGRESLSVAQRRELAQWYRETGNAREALAIVAPGGARQDSPPDPALASSHLRLTYDVEGPSRALQEIEWWSSTLVGNVAWARNAAQVLAKHGKQEQALRLLRDALVKSPNDGPTRSLLATLLPPGEERRKQRELAAHGDPPCPESVRELATELRRRGELDTSISLVRQALARMPSNVSLRRTLAEMSLEHQRSWPTLEKELREWVSETGDDALLECLVDLYVRSERWALIRSPELPLGTGETTRALVRAARVIADRSADGLRRLDDVPWSKVRPDRWLRIVVELFTLAVRSGDKPGARRWLEALPAEFDSIRAELRQLVETSESPRSP